MAEWKKRAGEETGVMEGCGMDWESRDIDFYEDVEYGRGGGHPMYLDLMMPRGEASGLRPVIIWVHGGGWSIPELTKKYRPAEALAQACEMGFVCASIEYRLVTEAPFPAPVEDCKCAVRFLKAHAGELGIDPDGIGIWGESAGGQLAALVGASYANPKLEGNGGWQEYSSEVRAVCDWYCGGDMTHMGAYECPEVQARARELGIRLTLMPRQTENGGQKTDEVQKGIFLQMFGKPGREAPELSMEISPIFYVDQRQPAFLLMHGDSDQAVTPLFSYNYYDALLKYGHDATFVVVPGQGHGFFKGQGYYDIVLGFFWKKLMLKK
ncbi:MAG: alpha/beta hydrolase [Roseburia sp.]|nr:alpha/beta hydrolase [Roseburia sp.]MCM1096790.1 alpha/beta hydrolase [Ruminococcus flavefaciens]